MTDRPDAQTPDVPRLAVKLRNLARTLGISERTARAWLAAGFLPKPSIEYGAVRLWSIDCIRAWLNAGGIR